MGKYENLCKRALTMKIACQFISTVRRWTKSLRFVYVRDNKSINQSRFVLKTKILWGKNFSNRGIIVFDWSILLWRPLNMIESVQKENWLAKVTVKWKRFAKTCVTLCVKLGFFADWQTFAIFSHQYETELRPNITSF